MRLRFFQGFVLRMLIFHCKSRRVIAGERGNWRACLRYLYVVPISLRFINIYGGFLASETVQNFAADGALGGLRFAGVGSTRSTPRTDNIVSLPA